MKVDLRTLQPNPTRDLKVDPHEASRVKVLRQSIQEHGFWGGVVVGQVNGTNYILSGHTRVEAAIANGITHADLFIAHEPTPEQMLHVYGMENASQRGTSSSAVAGTVAGAVRLIAKDLLSSPRTGRTARKDIGEPTVTAFLRGIPGFYKKVIEQQLANLKASGDYQRIVDAVKDEWERENPQQAEERKQAEKQKRKKARQAVDKPKVAPKQTFDLAGVQRSFKTAEHVSAFRKLVTGKLLKDTLPVSQQAPLAASLVALAEKQQRELTSRFIRDEALTMLSGSKSAVKAAARAEIERAGIEAKIRDHQAIFERSIRCAYGSLLTLSELTKQYKGEVTWTGMFVEAMELMQKMASSLGPKLLQIGGKRNA